MWGPGDIGEGRCRRVLGGHSGPTVAWQQPAGTAVSTPLNVIPAWPCTPSNSITAHCACNWHVMLPFFLPYSNIYSYYPCRQTFTHCVFFCLQLSNAYCQYFFLLVHSVVCSVGFFFIYLFFLLQTKLGFSDASYFQCSCREHSKASFLFFNFVSELSRYLVLTLLSKQKADGVNSSVLFRHVLISILSRASAWSVA